MEDEDHHREEGARVIEEEARHTEEAETGVEARDREAAEVVDVEVVVVATEIAMMTERASDREATLEAYHRHPDGEVEARGEARDTTVEAGVRAGHRRLPEEVVGVLLEVEVEVDEGEAFQATAVGVGALAESAAAGEGGDEVAEPNGCSLPLFRDTVLRLSM